MRQFIRIAAASGKNFYDARHVKGSDFGVSMKSFWVAAASVAIGVALLVVKARKPHVVFLFLTI